MCIQLGQWLVDGNTPIPPAELVVHIADCLACQAGLLALAGVQVGLPPDLIDCAICEDGLPTYIDLEDEIGLSQAAQRMSQIWWHVCLCPMCSETYEHMRAALAAVPPLPFVMPQPTALRVPFQQPIHLARSLLQSVFGMQLGPAYGDEDSSILAEEQRDGYRLSLSVMPHGRDAYSFSLMIQPVWHGIAVLQIGSLHLRALFDQQGLAAFAPIATTLLSEPDGDLIIALESGP